MHLSSGASVSIQPTHFRSIQWLDTQFPGRATCFKTEIAILGVRKQRIADKTVRLVAHCSHFHQMRVHPVRVARMIIKIRIHLRVDKLGHRASLIIGPSGPRVVRFPAVGMSHDYVSLHLRAGHRHPFIADVSTTWCDYRADDEIVDDIVYPFGGDTGRTSEIIIEDVAINERIVLVVITTDRRRQ